MKNEKRVMNNIREWQLTDIKSVTRQANNINIWNNVRDYFPHPYTEKDGKQFIQMVLNKQKPVLKT